LVELETLAQAGALLQLLWPNPLGFEGIKRQPKLTYKLILIFDYSFCLQMGESIFYTKVNQIGLHIF